MIQKEQEAMPLRNFIPQRPNLTLFCLLTWLETKEKSSEGLGGDSRGLKVGREKKWEEEERRKVKIKE